MDDMWKKKTEMSPTIFLDRDGVLNEEVGYISRIEQVKIFPYVRESIERLKSVGFLCIVISNQSGIARGYFDMNQLAQINKYISENTGVDKIYICPHYSKGIIPQYSIECNCRKPEIGMIRQAERDFTIDLSKSWFVGDRASDIKTGQNAGIRTILLESGYGTARMEEEVEPDVILENLESATEYILRNK